MWASMRPGVTHLPVTSTHLGVLGNGYGVGGANGTDLAVLYQYDAVFEGAAGDGDNFSAFECDHRDHLLLFFGVSQGGYASPAYYP